MSKYTEKYWLNPTFEHRGTGPSWRGMMPIGAVGMGLWLAAFYYYKDSNHSWAHFKNTSSRSALDALGMGKITDEAEEQTERDHERYRIASSNRPTRVVNKESYPLPQHNSAQKRYVE